MTAPDTEARSLAAQLRFLLATREAIVAHKFSFRQSPQIYATSEVILASQSSEPRRVADLSDDELAAIAARTKLTVIRTA